MDDETSIKESEYLDFLSLQVDSFQHLQNKADNIIRATIAIFAGIAVLFSANILEIDYIIPSVERARNEIATNTFMSEFGSRIITNSIEFLYIGVCLTLGVFIFVAYWRIVNIYGHFGMPPFVTEEVVNYHIIEDKNPDIPNREELLKENAAVLRQQYYQFRDAWILFLFSSGFILFNLALYSAILSNSLVNITIVCFIPFIWYYQFLSSIELQEIGGHMGIIWEFQNIFDSLFIKIPGGNVVLLREMFTMLIFLHIISIILLICAIIGSFFKII